jgi:PAS domain S-box-containing protein
MKRVSEKYYEHLVDNLNDAVYTVSTANLNFTSLNVTGEKLTGYTKKELLKTPISAIIAPEYLPLVKKMIARKQKRDTSTIYEIEIIRKDGVQIPVEISSRAILDNGNPVEILGIARDISERKLHEHQRDVFISLITHEIKNPLTSIKLYTQILQNLHKRDSKSKLPLEVISTQVKAMEELMNDFLSVTQMQIGKFKLLKEKYDLDEVINEVIRAYTSTSGHKIIKKGSIKTKVTGDRNRISQVLSNLLSNAIKYSPKAGEIVIFVVRNKSKVSVSVTDFGVGIPKSEQRKIFEIFSRTTHAMQSQIKGHGLGLYFCREIIKFHKGKLWVESALGTGSTFSFSIPLR